MTINEILNAVLLQSGFLERTVFYGGQADVDDKQMRAIATRSLRFIRDFYPWSATRKSAQITQQEGITRYALPADCESLMPDSIWEENGSRPAEFPVPDGRWFQYKFSTRSDAGIRRLRRYGDEIEIQDPQAGEVLSLEYVSGALVRAEDGVPKDDFTADTDTWVLDDQLLIDGIRAYWAETKLLPQSQAWMAEFMRRMNTEIAKDAGGRVIGSGRFLGPSRGSPYYQLWRPT